MKYSSKTDISGCVGKVWKRYCNRLPLQTRAVRIIAYNTRDKLGLSSAGKYNLYTEYWRAGILMLQVSSGLKQKGWGSVREGVRSLVGEEVRRWKVSEHDGRSMCQQVMDTKTGMGRGRITVRKCKSDRQVVNEEKRKEKTQQWSWQLGLLSHGAT